MVSPPTTQKAWVSPEVLDQILALGQTAAPVEACGIVTPDLRVVSLPNVTPIAPESSYALAGRDLVNCLEEYLDRVGGDAADLDFHQFLVWHTHPSGHIGPSKRDLETKHKGFRYVVVALPGGEATEF